MMLNPQLGEPTKLHDNPPIYRQVPSYDPQFSSGISHPHQVADHMPRRPTAGSSPLRSSGQKDFLFGDKAGVMVAWGCPKS